MGVVTMVVIGGDLDEVGQGGAGVDGQGGVELTATGPDLGETIAGRGRQRTRGCGQFPPQTRARPARWCRRCCPPW